MDAATAAGEFPMLAVELPGASPEGLWQTLVDRVRAEPFNLVASAIFVLAIMHTFLTPMIRQLAHRAEEHTANGRGTADLRRLTKTATRSPRSVSRARCSIS